MIGSPWERPRPGLSIGSRVIRLKATNENSHFIEAGHVTIRLEQVTGMAKMKTRRSVIKFRLTSSIRLAPGKLDSAGAGSLFPAPCFW